MYIRLRPVEYPQVTKFLSDYYKIPIDTFSIKEDTLYQHDLKLDKVQIEVMFTGTLNQILVETENWWFKIFFDIKNIESYDTKR